MAKQTQTQAIVKRAPTQMPGSRRRSRLRDAVGAMGRPSKLTPDVEAAIIAALKVGAYLETAAAFAGVDRITLYRWLRKGAAARYKTVYWHFRNAIQKAAAECDVKDLMTIEAASKGNWTAAAWRLERRSPQNWAIRGAGGENARGPLISITQENEQGGGRTTVVIDVGAEGPRRVLPQPPPVMIEGQAQSPVIDVKALDVTPKPGGNGNGNGAGKKRGR